MLPLVDVSKEVFGFRVCPGTDNHRENANPRMTPTPPKQGQFRIFFGDKKKYPK